MMIKDNSINYAVAIPIYNEAGFVRSVIQQVRRYAKRILVINDGSTDDTAKILAEIDGIDVIHHDQNHGYGRALINAFQWANLNQLDWIITMDCDGQHEPCKIPEFVKHAMNDDCDIISGSRYLASARKAGSPPPSRQAINYEITRIINCKLDMNLTDSFCGFKAYRCSAISKLPLDEDGYAMPMQLWALAAARELKIREIPVSLIYNDPNRTFGGKLDNDMFRRRHYMDVFNKALERHYAKSLDCECVDTCKKAKQHISSDTCTCCSCGENKTSENGTGEI